MVSRPMFRFVTATLAVAAITIAMAPAASASTTVIHGLDLFVTPSGGGNITTSIPAGMFCGGASGAVTKTFTLRGEPLVSLPAGGVSPTDTVLDRTQDAFFPVIPDPGKTSPAIIPVIIRALSMKSTNFLVVSCPNGTTESWQAEVGLTRHGDQVPGSMTIYHEYATGGTFSANFPVVGKVQFFNQATLQRVGSVNRNDQVVTSNTCWSHAPGPGTITWPFASWIAFDSNLDYVLTNVVDDYLSLYGTSNFYPGWCPNPNGGPPTYTPTKHTGPHPQTCLPGLPCPGVKPHQCSEVEIQTLRSAKTAEGFVFDGAIALNEAQVFGEFDLEAQSLTQVQVAYKDALVCLSQVGYNLNGR